MGVDLHGLAVILLTVVALVMFAQEKIPLEYSCTLVLALLVAGFEFFPYDGNVPLRGADFLAGFGNEALITICLLLVLAKGVEVSGALRPLGRILTKLWLLNRSFAMLATLVIAAFVSAFSNNTPIVVMLLPVLVGVARRIGFPSSRLLMPFGFATIVGGMSTTIGTSTNLLIVSLSDDYGLPRLQMFDFTLPAVIAGAVGVAYLWLIAPRLLPDRPSLLEGNAPRIFDAVVVVDEAGEFAGRTLGDVTRRLGKPLRVVRIERGEALELVRLPTLTIQAGDRLHVRGTPEAIQAAQEIFSVAGRAKDINRLPEERLVEVVVTRDSPLHGRRLAQAQEGPLRGLSPVGWYRPGRSQVTTVDRQSDPLLRTGDVLLMQGPRSAVQTLLDTPQILILARTIHVPRTDHAVFAISIMGATIAIAAFGIVPILASAMLGVGLMLATRCLSWGEAWSAIDSRLVLVIVTSLGLGAALNGTGAATLLAHGLVELTRNLPPPYIISGLLLTTALLTEIVTNNAVAVIVTPIAMSLATELGLDPLPFVLAVLFGANMSYLTPIGYQTNLLVMSAGGYRFSDFFRAGLPLQLILWLTLSFAIPALYL